MLMVVHKAIKTEFNDVEIDILHDACEIFPITKLPTSKKDRDYRNLESKIYRDDLTIFQTDLQKYIDYTNSRRFSDHKEMSDHKHNKGRGYNGKTVKLQQKDPELILRILDYYIRNKNLEVKPDNLIDGIGQIYKQDVEKLIDEMATVKDAMKMWRIKEIVYE